MVRVPTPVVSDLSGQPTGAEAGAQGSSLQPVHLPHCLESPQVGRLLLADNAEYGNARFLVDGGDQFLRLYVPRNRRLTDEDVIHIWVSYELGVYSTR